MQSKLKSKLDIANEFYGRRSGCLDGGGCFCGAHFLLIDMLQQAGIELEYPHPYCPGWSCKSERNWYRFDAKDFPKAMEILFKYFAEVEDFYKKQLIQQDEQGLIWMMRQKLGVHKPGPLRLPPNYFMFYATTYSMGTRDIGFFDLTKLRIRSHINITLPDKMYSCYAVGRYGSRVRDTEHGLSELTGKPVRLHYKDLY